MSGDDEEQQWRKHLRAHDRRLLAAVVAVLIGYFAALVGAINWSLHWGVGWLHRQRKGERLRDHRLADRPSLLA